MPSGLGNESFPMMDPTSLTFQDIVNRCSASPGDYQERFGHGPGPLDKRRSWPEALYCTHVRALAGHSITIQEQDKGVPHESLMSWKQLPKNWSKYMYHGTTRANSEKIRQVCLLPGALTTTTDPTAPKVLLRLVARCPG